MFHTPDRRSTVVARSRRIGAVIAVALVVLAGYHGAALQQSPDAAVAVPTYWCPMHPDVRGEAGDHCSRCGMALVAATAADYVPYLLDFEIGGRGVQPRQPARIRFWVSDPHSGTRVRNFSLVHERAFHLFVVSQDLDYFAHVHPALRVDGSLDLPLQVPRPGVYHLIADFLPTGGAPQFIQRSFTTAGYTGPLGAVPQLVPDTAAKLAGDTRVMLTMPDAIAGREQLITFDVRDEKTGLPAVDLEPYLGATGHLLVASADLAVAFHSHPIAEISSAVGPTVVFQVLFPTAGDYRMWAQFERHGHVLTTAFTVPVRPAY